jgi:hypothetical protein
MSAERITLDFLTNSVWPGLIAWIILYISDYVLTLSSARLYRAGVDKKIVFEGSFELTPYYQKDIDSLRVLSPRFVTALLVNSFLLVVVWRLSEQLQPAFYECALGAMISSELAIHVRHVRNLSLFRAMVAGDCVRGRIEYSRSVILRLSAVEFLAFSGLFAVLFVFTRSWFVLGGVLSCLSTWLKHRRLARSHQATVLTSQVESRPIQTS